MTRLQAIAEDHVVKVEGMNNVKIEVRNVCRTFAIKKGRQGQERRVYSPERSES